MEWLKHATGAKIEHVPFKGFPEAMTAFKGNEVQLIAQYFWLTVWPQALVLDYGLPRALTVWALPGAAFLLSDGTAVSAGLSFQPTA